MCPISKDHLDWLPKDQQTIEKMARENPLKYTELIDYNRIKKYLEK